MKTLVWLIKRELWEYRGSMVGAPVVGGLLFLLLTLMGWAVGEVSGAQFHEAGASLSGLVAHLNAHDLALVGAGLDLAMLAPALILSMILGFVVFFYCLGTLYDDRRDRSILFWRSLPISDTQTVLAKVLTATVVAPAITFGVGLLTGVLLLLIYVIALSFHGVSVGALLMLAHPVHVTLQLVGSIALYALWALPTVGWLMLCSAWAKGKPFVWAVATPVVGGVCLWWFGMMLGVGHVAVSYWSQVLPRVLGGVFPGSWMGHAVGPVGLDGAGKVLDVTQMYGVLATPSALWGIGAGVIFLMGAVTCRRWRDDA